MNLEELEVWIDRVKAALSEVADAQDIEIKFTTNACTGYFEDNEFKLKDEQ